MEKIESHSPMLESEASSAEMGVSEGCVGPSPWLYLLQLNWSSLKLAPLVSSIQLSWVLYLWYLQLPGVSTVLSALFTQLHSCTCLSRELCLCI